MQTQPAPAPVGLDAYVGHTPAPLLRALRRQAERLRGLRVLHLNATPYGGGVAEMLRSAIPLLRGLGIDAQWACIDGRDDFFRATKRLHNALQGGPTALDEGDWAAYEANLRWNALDGARRLGHDWDVVVVHDPQPAALRGLVDPGRARWVWRCHIDTSAPQPQAWRDFRSYLAGYDAAVFTLRPFIPTGHPLPRDAVALIPPAIDPRSPKNEPLPADPARRVLREHGLDPARPLAVQVARFDPWKDPVGVVAAWRAARERVPGLQLVLVGSMAHDDPEGATILAQVRRACEGEQDVRILLDVSDLEVNALQRGADVVLVKSLREGFGLTVAEALWKGTPVVAGRAGGLQLQLADGAGGLLVDSVEGCSEAMVALLQDPARARALAERGRRRVAAQFLLPRMLLDELALLARLEGEDAETELPRDPVCGMAVADGSAFCSEACRRAAA